MTTVGESQSPWSVDHDPRIPVHRIDEHITPLIRDISDVQFRGPVAMFVPETHVQDLVAVLGSTSCLDRTTFEQRVCRITGIDERALQIPVVIPVVA